MVMSWFFGDIDRESSEALLRDSGMKKGKYSGKDREKREEEEESMRRRVSDFPQGIFWCDVI
jgi:hypothetical protein